MITATGLTKRFGKLRAVDDLSFRTEQGEALALWGANGAGKTTALRCVLGLLRCRGDVRIGGIDAHRAPRQARRLIGYVPQELAFHDDLRVRDTMHFYARLRRVGRGRIDEALGGVDLSPHAPKRVRELSGGMKQRLALALALLADPPALLLDEPTSNLDASGRDDIAALLDEQKRRGKTILFTSHRLDEIEAIADRVLGLSHGRLVFECRGDELVDAAGLRCGVRVFVHSGRVGDAVRALAARGYDPTAEHASVRIETAANRKAEPIVILSGEGIPVFNVEFTNRHHARPSQEDRAGDVSSSGAQPPAAIERRGGSARIDTELNSRNVIDASRSNGAVTLNQASGRGRAS